mgnify:CR=1 FL=1
MLHQRLQALHHGLQGERSPALVIDLATLTGAARMALVDAPLLITGETGVWGFSALTVGLNAAFYRAAAPHQRVQVAMQRGVRMYHDQTTRPLQDIRWELLTLLSHGAFVTMVDKTGFDGALDPLAYERTGEAFAEAQAKRPHHNPFLFQERIQQISEEGERAEGGS